MASKCGVRAHYWKHHTGICELPLHDDSVEHLVEVVTIDTNKTNYGELGRGPVVSEQHEHLWIPNPEHSSSDMCRYDNCNQRRLTGIPMRIYTDGGYRGEIGGWGWWNETTKENDCGWAYPSTNQRMELQAAIDAIDTYLEVKDLTIVSDSAYLVNCMTNNWFKRWHMNGWRNAKGQPVANQDLWETLGVYVQENPGIKFEKVKGHSGVHGNEMADKLATQAILDYLEAGKKINELRELIHIHSVVYYHMHTSLVTDAEWDRWALDLMVLQRQHPELAKTGYESESFKDWTDATGMHLPRTERVLDIATRLVERAAG